MYKGVFLKCAEILHTRLWDKQLKKNCSSKIKCHFIFWQNFLNIISEFYMKPSSSWLKFYRAFQGHLYISYFIKCTSVCCIGIDIKLFGFENVNLTVEILIFQVHSSQPNKQKLLSVVFFFYYST
jgi:hypothetical protein